MKRDNLQKDPPAPRTASGTWHPIFNITPKSAKWLTLPVRQERMFYRQLIGNNQGLTKAKQA